MTTEDVPTDDPARLLESLRHQGASCDFRSFAVTCCRHIWAHLPTRFREAIEIAEAYASASANDGQRRAAYAAVQSCCIYVDGESTPHDRWRGFAAEAVLCCLYGDSDYPPIPDYAATCAIAAAAAVVEVVGAAAELRGDSEEECHRQIEAERRQQCEAIHRHFRLPVTDGHSAQDQRGPGTPADTW